jgi:hypothetical protein
MRATAARMLAGSNWGLATQSASQLVTNSVAPANSELVIPVEAGGVYKFELMASFRAPTANGLAAAWNVPGATVMYRFVTAPGISNSGTRQNLDRVSLEIPVDAASLSAAGGSGSSDSAGYHERGTIEAVATGDCIWRFAQRVAGAGTSAELRGTYSRVTWIRIG